MDPVMHFALSRPNSAFQNPIQVSSSSHLQSGPGIQCAGDAAVAFFAGRAAHSDALRMTSQTSR